jgi:hypothetical protein
MARSRLTDVAELLWPPPAVVSIRRRRLARSREWLVVPSLRHPRWLLPAGCSEAAVALERHDVGQRREWLPSLLAGVYRRVPVERLPLARIAVDLPPGTTSIEDALSRLLGTPLKLCVRLGRNRENRAVVLRAIDGDGVTWGYVKMAGSKLGEGALEAEAANLQRIRSVDISPVTAPDVLFVEQWNNRRMLVMSPLLPPDREGAVGTRRTDMPTNEMLTFAATRGTTVLPLRDAPFVSRLERHIAALPSEDDGPRQLGTALSFLLSRHGHRDVTLGCWHGDWVPWNMSWAGEHIQLWDWEHYSEGVPVGWDPLHFGAQQLRNTRGTGVHIEDEWLDSSRSVLLETVTTDGDVADAVILAYLLEVNVRYLQDRSGHSDTAVRLGWGLPLLDRLTRAARP